MKKIFKWIKSIFKKFWNTLKGWFLEPEPVDDTNDNTEDPVDPTIPIIISDNDNFPIDAEHIKLGELAAYMAYDKRKGAVINEEFINNVRELGLSIIYMNSPRDKKEPESFVTYDEWLSIFDMFTDSGVKLMIYIYETLDKKDTEGNVIYKKWTNAQIQSISNHPAFYGWIAEDEVSYKGYANSQAWIKTFHKQTLNKKPKWPNMSVTFFPKSNTAKNKGWYGESYDDYLEMWSDAADVFMADMYPIVTRKTNGEHYDIEGDGIEIYSKGDGGDNWFEYLNAHLDFTNNHPELTHRLYIHTCKHIAKESNSDKLYLAYPKPTEVATKIQTYANLMAGSNGVILFLGSDIKSTGQSFCETPFNDDFTINEDVYNMLKSYFNNPYFKNFKSLIVNLKINEISRPSDTVLYCNAQNNEYEYLMWLNMSLENDFDMTFQPEDMIMNFTDNTVIINKDYTHTNILPGQLVCVKRKLDK